VFIVIGDVSHYQPTQEELAKPFGRQVNRWMVEEPFSLECHECLNITARLRVTENLRDSGLSVDKLVAVALVVVSSS
jgi:hypothetical protein